MATRWLGKGVGAGGSLSACLWEAYFFDFFTVALVTRKAGFTAPPTGAAGSATGATDAGAGVVLGGGITACGAEGGGSGTPGPPAATAAALAAADANTAADAARSSAAEAPGGGPGGVGCCGPSTLMYVVTAFSPSGRPESAAAPDTLPSRNLAKGWVPTRTGRAPMLGHSAGKPM
jgi:hypothetical protein